MATMKKKKRVDRSVYELALERINRAFDLYDTIDVSFSGGKDSSACLNLTLQVARERGKLPLRVFFHDEEAIPYQTEEYVRRLAQHPDIALEWYCLPVKHRNACSRQHPWWSPWDPAQQDLWVRPMPPEGITRLAGFDPEGEPRDRYSIPEMAGLLHDPKTYGTVGMVMGIRAQESLTRTRAVVVKTEENYLIHWKDGTSRGNIWKVYPIYDWQTEDVWTAPNRFGWDYNRAYDVMDQMGIPPLWQRCSPAYGEEPLQKFHLYKSCFPEIWGKMSKRVPGANTAMLYSRSELFGFGKMLSRPEHQSWQETVLHFINKYPPAEQTLVAENVEMLLREHYNKTTDPILSEVDHPITGISWRRILNVAQRGDFKGRRSRNMVKNSGLHDDKNLEKMWAKYQAARVEEGL